MDRYAYSVREKRRPSSDRRRHVGGAGRDLGTNMGLEMLQQWNDMYAPLVDNMNQMWRGVMSSWLEAMDMPWQEARRSSYWHRDCDCGCGDCPECRSDTCHCVCCIGDADLVVYARWGERRLVPIEIENSRRREREIRLELSGFSSRRGKANDNISGQIMPPTEFTLAACERREIILLVNVAGQPNTSPDQPRERVPDVDECEIWYADLRVEGCDIRPIRIALALLPRDCDPYEIECRCGCC